jgi:flagellar protein FlaI
MSLKKSKTIHFHKGDPATNENATLSDNSKNSGKQNQLNNKAQQQTKNEPEKPLSPFTSKKKIGKTKKTKQGASSRTFLKKKSSNEKKKTNGHKRTSSLFKSLHKKPKEETSKEQALEMPSIKELVTLNPEDGSGTAPKEFDVEALKTKTIHQLGYSETKSWEELDFYQIEPQFSYAVIIQDADTRDKLYILMENALTQREIKIYNFIRNTLSKFSLDTESFESKGRDKYLCEQIDVIIADYLIQLHPTSKEKITYYLKKHFLGFGKLDPLMKDPNIEDISCDGSQTPVFLYHRKEGSLRSTVIFEDEDELSAFVVRLSQKCGKHISIANPMLDATMPDGSRIQMTLSDEVTTRGSTFTVRKFKEDPLSPADLISFHTMSSEMTAYMWMAVEYGANALIAGGTAAGKTSLLNAIASFIPREAKIVSIEETREINLPHSNWIPGVARSGFGEVVGDKLVGEIDMYDLMKAALRQRPEYILVGEIRGKEAYVLFQAMATGHTTYSTVHADSAKSLIHRLEGKPINIPRIMLQALDIVCIQVISKVGSKRVRRTKTIIEIIDIDPETKEILTNEVFHWNPIEDKFVYSGKSYILERIRVEKNLNLSQITQELRNRAMLLDWMNNRQVKGFANVASWTAKYTENPSDVMNHIQQTVAPVTR